jgi:nucleotide-binding universal stress UspA family protein
MKSTRQKSPNPPKKRTGTRPVAALRFARILAPLDFSSTATDALRFVRSMARETGARVDLLHVIPPLALPAETSHLPEGWSRYEDERRREAAQRLAALAAAETGQDVRTRLIVRIGDPAAVIVDTARARRSDLLVVSTHGRSGLTRFFLGSTAEAVVRHAPCPVLTVRRRVLARSGAALRPMSERINRILVPVDFSAPSEAAVRHAVEFAQRFGASLRLLHVVRRIEVPIRLARDAGRLQAAVYLDGEERLTAWAQRVVPAGVEMKHVVAVGEPYEVITGMARQEKLDLIVISTHGHSGLNRLFLGSTAERIVRHAACPVLVIRRPERKPARPRRSRRALDALSTVPVMPLAP